MIIFENEQELRPENEKGKNLTISNKNHKFFPPRYLS